MIFWYFIITSRKAYFGGRLLQKVSLNPSIETISCSYRKL